MQAALKAFTALFGAVCAAIGMVHIVVGPSAIPGSIPVNSTMDSEDRFYATLFVGFGLAMVWCSRNLAERGGVFAALLATFFAGGIARIVSAIAVGPPSPLFIFLGSLELVLPPLMWVWRRRAWPS
jgi:hypothetical protein